MIVTVLLKIKFGHVQISVPKIGISMSKTACIIPWTILILPAPSFLPYLYTWTRGEEGWTVQDFILEVLVANNVK